MSIELLESIIRPHLQELGERRHCADAPEDARDLRGLDVRYPRLGHVRRQPVQDHGLASLVVVLGESDVPV